MILLKKRKANQSSRLYQDLKELPIWNWDKIQKSGDLRYLIILDDYEDLPEADNLETLAEHFYEIQDEFHLIQDGAKTIGGHYMEKWIELLELKRDALVMSCDDYNPHLSVAKTKITMSEREFKERAESSSGEPQDLEEQAVFLEIFFKMPFDTRKMSTFKWFKYLQSYEEQAQEIRKND